MRHIRFVLVLVSILVLPGWAPAMADEAKPEPAPKQDRCDAPTGSRIAPRPDSTGQCPEFEGPGQTYDREDLQRTGETNAAKALSRLNPSISTNGY